MPALNQKCWTAGADAKDGIKRCIAEAGLAGGALTFVGESLRSALRLAG